MADEPSDQRPRRRFFGRRRAEYTPETSPIPSAAPVTPNRAGPDIETQDPAASSGGGSAPPTETAVDEARADLEPAPGAVAVESPAVDDGAEEAAPEVEVETEAETEPEKEAAELGTEAELETETELETEAEDGLESEDGLETGGGSQAQLAGVEDSSAADSAPDDTGDEDPDTGESLHPRDDERVAAATALDDDVVLPLPRVIAIANQKGGVGKTTTAVNLGAALAEAGYRTLVVDLDPQGNASTGLGISPRDVETSVYDVIMTDAPALDCVEPTSLKNLFVLPATIDLAGAEIELVAAFSRELKLRRALDAVRVEYDVILIDCPPSLGLLTVNGLAAADDVIVPVQSEYYALEGLGQLLKNVAMVRSVNPTLDVRGIVLTMHDSRTKLAEQVESEVRQHFGAKVYKTVVPRTVRLSEAPSFGQPIIVFDPTSRGASAYRELAKEVSGGATRRTG
jgi:chromosome partitioning protein